MLSSPAAYLSLYLIDSVSGGVVHQAVHRHCVGPVGVVIAENWVVVS